MSPAQSTLMVGHKFQAAEYLALGRLGWDGRSPGAYEIAATSLYPPERDRPEQYDTISLFSSQGE